MKIKKYKSLGLTHMVRHYTFQLLVDIDGEEKTLHFYYQEDDNGSEMEIYDNENNLIVLSDFGDEIDEHVWMFLSEHVQGENVDDDWIDRKDWEIE